MKTLKRPYKIIPIVDLREKGYPWVDQMEADARYSISLYENLLKEESEIDRNPYLVDEDFLYECFLDNVEHKLIKDNWQVLKYWCRILKIKVLKDMIGEFTLTQSDLEMYRHFVTMTVDDTTRCKPKYLNLHNYKTDWHGDINWIALNEDIASADTVTEPLYGVTIDSSDVFPDHPYWNWEYKDFFEQPLKAISVMINHVRNGHTFEDSVSRFKRQFMLSEYNEKYLIDQFSHFMFRRINMNPLGDYDKLHVVPYRDNSSIHAQNNYQYYYTGWMTDANIG